MRLILSDGHPDVIFTSAFYELEDEDVIPATILPVDAGVKSPQRRLTVLRLRIPLETSVSVLSA